MKTAIEVGLERAEARAHVIPAITHPWGKSWDQPSRFRIDVDDNSALMEWSIFLQLKEYSASQPSGVYEGKMWRRHNGIYDAEFRRRGGKPEWMLVWYGKSDKPEMCSVNMRTILISNPEKIDLKVWE